MGGGFDLELTAGTLRTVTWTHNLGTVETVDIELGRDGGNTRASLASNVTNRGNGSGTYRWTVSVQAPQRGVFASGGPFEGTVRGLGNVKIRIQ